MDKDYTGWHQFKDKLDSDYKTPTFKQREIWWCSTGINVGVEQNGKNTLYERPVIIIRKFNRHLFWGLPVTSKLKDFPFYHPVFFKATKEKEPKERRVILSQLRAYDSARLSRPMAKLGHKQFEEIIEILMTTLKQ